MEAETLDSGCVRRRLLCRRGSRRAPTPAACRIGVAVATSRGQGSGRAAAAHTAVFARARRRKEDGLADEQRPPENRTGGGSGQILISRKYHQIRYTVVQGTSSPSDTAGAIAGPISTVQIGNHPQSQRIDGPHSSQGTVKEL